MTNGKRQEKSKLALRLLENGVRLSVDGPWQYNALQIRQIGGQTDSRAFDLGSGATGYVINSNINIITNNISITDIYLQLPWADYSISLLVDPLEIGGGDGNYRFFGRKKQLLEIARAEVLNHRLIRTQLFRRGASFQGLLLWAGLESIPDEFAHGGNSPATVVFFDQFENKYSSKLTLGIDRRHRWVPKKGPKLSRAPLSQDVIPSLLPPHGARKVEAGMMGGRR